MAGQLLAEHLPDGSWIDYVYVDGQRLATVAQPLSTTDNPSAPQTTFYISDPLGMERLMLAQDGTVLDQGVFAPFGDPLTSTTAANISYSDEVHDPETGLDTYQYRAYNPRIGRWMSPDPSSLHFSQLTNPQTYNLYAFVVNDPLKYIDAHGLAAEDGVLVDADYSDDVDDYYSDEQTNSFSLAPAGGGGGSDGSDGDDVDTTSNPNIPVVVPDPNDPNTTVNVSATTDNTVDTQSDSTDSSVSEETIQPYTPDPPTIPNLPTPCPIGGCTITVNYTPPSPFVVPNACTGINASTGKQAQFVSIWSCAGNISSCKLNQGSYQSSCTNQGYVAMQCAESHNIYSGQGSYTCQCCNYGW